MDGGDGRLIYQIDSAPPPAHIANNAWLRRLIQDPPGKAFIALVDALPIKGRKNVLYYDMSSYDGAMWEWSEENGWEEPVARFANAELDAALAACGGNVQIAAVALLSEWEGGVDIDAYYTSANSGAESITWPSLAERSAWFAARKKAVNDLFALKSGKTAAAWAAARPPMVGGER
jgi:hypothetical protein